MSTEDRFAALRQRVAVTRVRGPLRWVDTTGRCEHIYESIEHGSIECNAPTFCRVVSNGQWYVYCMKHALDVMNEMLADCERRRMEG